MAINNMLFQDSEPIFTSTFIHAAIGMALVQPNGKLLRVNKSLCAFLGYDEDTLCAMNFQQLTYPDDLQSDLSQVQQLLRGKIQSFQMEKRYLHRNGHVVWAQLSVSLVRDEQGVPRFFISQITDINEHKLAEQALRRNKERLELVIEGTGVGLWDWQINTGEVVFNERWAELVGYTLAELAPINIGTWDRLAHPDDLQRCNEMLRQHFAGATEYYECEVRLCHKQGHWVWVLDRGKVVEWDDAGQPVRMAGTHLDITTRKQAEHDARRYNRLYATLSQVNQTISRTKDRQQLFTRICEVAVEFGHFLLVCVTEINRSTGEVRPIAFAGKDDGYLTTISLNIHQPDTLFGPTGIAVSENRIYVTQDIATDSKMAPWRTKALAHGFRSSAAFPLRQKGEITGTLNLYAGEAGFFNKQEQELLNAISNDLSFALDALQAEVETKSSHELFVRLFHLSPIANALVRLSDHVFVDVNAAFEALHQRSRAEVLGHNSLELNIWADAVQRQELLGKAIYQEPIRDAEFDFINGIGERRTGLLYAEIIHHNDEHYILSNTVDITDRKALEESLKRSGEALRLQVSALEAAANAIVIANRTGTLEWVNSAFTALTGYTAAESIGKHLRDLVRSGKHDDNFYRELWQTILSGKVWRGELINQRKNGSLYTEEQTITPVRNAEGVISHFIAIKTDVSRDREIQANIQRQERLAAIGQLASGIAHDFNNIMAVIVLYSQLVARSSMLSARDRERLLTIHQQAEHAAHMIRQILDFSRQGIMERRPLDLLPNIKEHVKLLQRTLPENIEVILTTEAAEYIVLADPTRIQQIVMNLALNARDALLDGGKLHLHLCHLATKERNVPMAGMEPGDWVCLTVSDSGIGIPTADIPHLFEPFFTTKPPGQGTGLGLPQVYGIVHEHGGQIALESEVGQGTTVTIYLPEINVNKEQTDELPRMEMISGNQETVLVIEDNHAVREALVEVLQQLNYCPHEATDGEAALTLLADLAHVDVILTDLVMPKMGGIEFVRTVHAQGFRKPIIIMTGHPLDNDIKGLRQLGVKACLMKPPTPMQLSQTLASALNVNKV